MNVSVRTASRLAQSLNIRHHRHNNDTTEKLAYTVLVADVFSCNVYTKLQNSEGGFVYKGKSAKTPSYKIEGEVLSTVINLYNEFCEICEARFKGSDKIKGSVILQISDKKFNNVSFKGLDVVGWEIHTYSVILDTLASMLVDDKSLYKFTISLIGWLNSLGEEPNDISIIKTKGGSVNIILE